MYSSTDLKSVSAIASKFTTLISEGQTSAKGQLLSSRTLSRTSALGWKADIRKRRMNDGVAPYPVLIPGYKADT